MMWEAVESIEIVEADEDVISLIQSTWQKYPWHSMAQCTIIHMEIEDYLKTTSSKYDTVYIDTWDAIYQEYLPHLNWLADRVRTTLNPGGEVLFWAYDLMVRQFMKAAVLVLERREKYLAANPAQMRNLAHQYPFLNRLVQWLKGHPKCSDDAFKTEAYRMAIRDGKNLGILKLSMQPGADALLHRKYFQARNTYGPDEKVSG